MNMNYYLFCIISLLLTIGTPLTAQERVYVSTDKEYYIAGESVWYSAYCFNESRGKSGFFSSMSSVAYLEFHNTAGLSATVKAALVNGRGCGKFEIPFSLPTGNYSIVAYTKQSGGNSTNAYRGKIITIFNTLSNERVKEGVEITDRDKDISITAYPKRISRDLTSVIQKKDRSIIPVTIQNNSKKKMWVNVSIYHIDPISKLIGEYGYDHTNLLDRKGDFAATAETEYEGEIIRAQIQPKIENKTVCMSVLGGKDDIYISQSDSLGNLIYYTGNIYGQPDLVFEVIEGNNIAQRNQIRDTNTFYSVELINTPYTRRTENIPVLRISTALSEALIERSQQMQIIRRFDSDTLTERLKFRKAPLLSTVKPIIYNLDEYTRFPLMEEVVREYIAELRLRVLNGSSAFQTLITEGANLYSYSKEHTFVLLDGVPIRDHKKIATLDPLLVKQIIIYPHRIVISDHVCDGVVDFRTYKGDLGGIPLSENTSIINYKGTQYPVAFTGEKATNRTSYPNYHQTIYWNPTIEITGNGEFSFNCFPPQYKGEFKIVVEGIDDHGNDIHYTTRFSVE